MACVWQPELAGCSGRRVVRRERKWEACARIRNTLYLSNHKLLVRVCQAHLGSAGVVTLACAHGRTHAPASVPGALRTATARRASTLLYRSRGVVRGVCATLATDGPVDRHCAGAPHGSGQQKYVCCRYAACTHAGTPTLVICLPWCPGVFSPHGASAARGITNEPRGGRGNTFNYVPHHIFYPSPNIEHPLWSQAGHARRRRAGKGFAGAAAAFGTARQEDP
jgi:hypothetical protein